MASEERVHHFQAEAGVFNAKLQRPLQQEVKPQAFVKLADEGGYLSERAENYRLEGIVSFQSAYTQVAGNKSRKPGHGWTTLATSAIEGLNVLDVVTADRVVAQISTDHPLEGYVPTVTFLGTRFENLRIAGHKIEPELNLDICGPRSSDDRRYIEDAVFLKRVSEQYARINSAKTLPDWARERYHWPPRDFSKDRQLCDKARKDKNEGRPEGEKPKVECSLVNSTGAQAVPGTSFGHVLEVPDFGKIFLAELTVDCDTFHLTMIRLEMGCVADGTGSGGTTIVNGHTKP